jgi:diguanylate cyclase (GGDEF)-like protein/PAS domain S-box-containing protein
LNILFNEAPIGMRLIDTRGVIRDVNRAFCDLVGLRSKDLIGQEFTRYVSPDLRQSMMENFHRQMKKGKIDSDTSSYIKLWNGEERYLHTVHRLIEVPEGKLIFSMFVDRSLEQKAQEEMEKSATELERLALTDPLTELGNRRYLMERLEAEFSRSRRNKIPLSLLVIDVDHFKTINDRFGHATGDAALKHFARLLRDCIRACDTPARFGGEEFCIILSDTPLNGARIIAERIRSRVAHQYLEANDGSKFQITCSIGVAEADLTTDTPASLFERADQHVYRAKQSGRNCVVG